MTGSDSFRLGVNYWPARTAMYWWDDVQFSEVDRGMARIAHLGLQEARIFLPWEAFQPRPERVSNEALRRLETVGCGLAVSTESLRGAGVGVQ